MTILIAMYVAKSRGCQMNDLVNLGPWVSAGDRDMNLPEHV